MLQGRHVASLRAPFVRSTALIGPLMAVAGYSETENLILQAMVRVIEYRICMPLSMEVSQPRRSREHLVYATSSRKRLSFPNVCHKTVSLPSVRPASFRGDVVEVHVRNCMPNRMRERGFSCPILSPILL